MVRTGGRIRRSAHLAEGGLIQRLRAESLNRRFGLSILEALANCITITISMDGLPKEESFAYLEARLAACGAKTPLLTKSAMELIHQAAGGILRTIGTIANASLLKAFMAKSPQVEAEHVHSVIQR